WYLLASKPREEERARINLERQGYHVYLPLVKRERRRRGKITIHTEPLFPRYLFIQLDRENDNWAPIRSTFGVSGLVGFGSQHTNYIPIPHSVITTLRSHEDKQGLHSLEKSTWFKQGDTIRVTSGPFAEIEGVFVMDDGEHRSMILIEMLGKQQHITIESSQLSASTH
ncbi:MAG: transcription/translation regulatory transformer protein RfaH, partial [Gammaproteobacteria bacterium]|nr:transcription/translation regulatory transformer protein RfaH [Gammaproteobacteria bacterium]